MAIFTASDGCRVYYEAAGEGRPVVLVPGLGGDGRFWSGVVENLPDSFRVIVVDHRGAGRSGRPISGYSLARIAADVVGIMDQENVARAHIAGHSTGGAVAQVMAVEHAGRLSSCTISSSWLKADARFRMLFGLRKSLLRDNRFEDYQRLTHVLGFPARWIDEHQQELEVAVTNARRTLSPPEVQLARIDMLLAHDCGERAATISTPTLVIGAEDDALLPLEYSERIAARISGSRLVKLRGGHFHPRTEPGQFAGVLRSFIDGLGSCA